MKNIAILLVAITTIFTFSCKRDDESLKSGKINLFFHHKVGSEKMELNNLRYSNISGHNYEIRTLKYFISNITFFKSNGDLEVYEKPIYIDADKSSTLSYSGIEIPMGRYESIGITFGLDSNINISDTLTTVQENSMSWPGGNQGGGYHYMKLEGTYDSLGIDSINKNYNIHMGPTMGHNYYFDINFNNSAFTFNDNDLNINLIMDVNEWFTNPKAYDFAEYGHMIMMNMAAQMQLKENGSSVFSIIID